MRLAVYGAVTTALTAMVLSSTLNQHRYFYPACIRLTQSNANLLILANMAFFLTLLLGKGLQRTFFGNLRAIEVEHLYEKGWFAVTETCLALTIFKDEFNAQMFALLLTLMFFKVFHWLVEDRIDFMEQSPAITWVYHLRMVTLISLLITVDILFLTYAMYSTFTGLGQGLSILVVFGFEFAILLVMLLATVAKYTIYSLDRQRPDSWDSKSMCIFFVDLAADFLQLILYLGFFALIAHFYGLPFHIIFNVYATLRSFAQKCRDLMRYRQATRNMNERYPTVSAEELAQLPDSTCIICREEMMTYYEDGSDGDDSPVDSILGERTGPKPQGEIPKRLPCGHIFHFNCLRSWLERQQTCPTCRQSVLSEPASQPTAANANPDAPSPRPSPQAPDTDHSRSNRATSAATSAPNSELPGSLESLAHDLNRSQQHDPVAQPSPHQPTHGLATGCHLSPLASDRDGPAAPGTFSGNAPRSGFAAHAPPPPAESTPTQPFSDIQGSFFRPLLTTASSRTAPHLTPLVPVVPGISEADWEQGNGSVPLTDAQLRMLTLKSREAVRERLRILNGIHNAVWRSIGQLNQIVAADDQLLAALNNPELAASPSDAPVSELPSSHASESFAIDQSHPSTSVGTFHPTAATEAGGSKDVKGKGPSTE
ncbi:E3 ubiquitin-protein ligase hrd1 [Dimargaris xerosporica]|nr:E3 ubiquitin-protein ligase hrd1 [Dimargaris xerosporica]